MHHASSLKHSCLFSLVITLLTAYLIHMGLTGTDMMYAQHFHQGASPFMTTLQASLLSEIFSKPMMLSALLSTGVVLFVFKDSTEIPIRFKRASAIMFSTVFLATAITVTLKVMLGRYRPEAYFTIQAFGFSGLSFEDITHSMPSGHTTRAFSILLSLTTFSRGRAWVFVLPLIAASVGLSRLVLERHYFSDVVLAAYIGTLCFIWCRYLIDRIKALALDLQSNKPTDKL